MGKKYADIVSKCKSSGTLFEDEDFPCEESSIFYKEQDEFDWSDIEWKRPNEICKEPKFQVKQGSKFDIHQGDLGNCWFLSAVATLATRPDLFSQVVPMQSFKRDYHGVFRFNLWRFGKWIEVCVDDRLPTKDGDLVFCRNEDCCDEFWGALLEKAYAKVFGCYQTLDAGYGHEALVDFTGGIGEMIALEDGVEHPKELFDTLERIHQMNSLICCAINMDEGCAEEGELENGLVSGHVYSVTGITKIHVKGKTVRLIRCRNPWGCQEWNGDYGDNSSSWENVADRVKAKLQLAMVEDGEFWMPFKDFLQNFHTIQVCHLTPDSMGRPDMESGTKQEWQVATFHGKWQKNVCAGGRCDGDEDSYWKNPQFTFTVTEPDDGYDEEDDFDDDDEGDEWEDEFDDDEWEDATGDRCTVVIALMQKHRRVLRTQLKTDEDQELAIGFDIHQYTGANVPKQFGNCKFEKHSLCLREQLEGHEHERERSARFRLEPGTYCVLPTTYEPEEEADFMLRMGTVKPITDVTESYNPGGHGSDSDEY